VLCVVGLGTSVEQAADTAYRQVREIEWDGAYYRSDIGHRAIARERA
jgi:phosphoribosylamine--glycine ligase